MSADAAAPFEVELFVDPASLAFDGHFPGAPVLPGAHLLGLVMRAIALHPAWSQRIGTAPLLQQVKFLSAVAPGQVLHLRLEANGPGLSFHVHRGGTSVARGQFAAARDAAAAGIARA